MVKANSQVASRLGVVILRLSLWPLKFLGFFACDKNCPTVSKVFLHLQKVNAVSLLHFNVIASSVIQQQNLKQLCLAFFI